MLLYSARLRRRIVTRPGSAREQSSVKELSTHFTSAARWAFVGCGIPSGGMCRFATFFATLFHIADFFSAAPAATPFGRITPPGASFPAWQGVQNSSTTGATSFA